MWGVVLSELREVVWTASVVFSLSTFGVAIAVALAHAKSEQSWLFLCNIEFPVETPSPQIVRRLRASHAARPAEHGDKLMLTL